MQGVHSASHSRAHSRRWWFWTHQKHLKCREHPLHDSRAQEEVRTLCSAVASISGGSVSFSAKFRRCDLPPLTCEDTRGRLVPEKEARPPLRCAAARGPALQPPRREQTWGGSGHARPAHRPGHLPAHSRPEVKGSAQRAWGEEPGRREQRLHGLEGGRPVPVPERSGEADRASSPRCC